MNYANGGEGEGEGSSDYQTEIPLALTLAPDGGKLALPLTLT